MTAEVAKILYKLTQLDESMDELSAKIGYLKQEIDNIALVILPKIQYLEEVLKTGNWREGR